MAFTDAAVKALRPQAGRYMKCDGSGLYIEVLPSGEKSWIYRYRLAGASAKVSLGRYPLMSLKAARGKRDDMRKLVRDGISPVEQRRRARAEAQGDPTVREFGDRYFREFVQPNWKSPDGIRRYLDKEIYPALGDKHLQAVTALDVQAVVYCKRDNGRIASALRIRSVIRSMFAYAIEKQLVESNPAAMVATRFIGKPRRRDRALSPKEIGVYLLTIYRSNIRRQFKLALHIAPLTLVRKSELLQARWDHIDLDSGEWHVPSQNSKSGMSHDVYLSRQVTAMFRELRVLAGKSELVLPGRSSVRKPFSANALNKALEGLSFEATMPNLLLLNSFRKPGTFLINDSLFHTLDLTRSDSQRFNSRMRSLYTGAIKGFPCQSNMSLRRSSSSPRRCMGLQHGAARLEARLTYAASSLGIAVYLSRTQAGLQRWDGRIR